MGRPFSYRPPPNMGSQPVLLPDPVADWAQQFPYKTALYTDSEHWTWATLDEMAHRMAIRLHKEGFLYGDVLAVCATTQPRYIALLLACLRKGIVCCPLNSRLPNAVLQEQAKWVKAKALYRDEDLNQDLPPINTAYITQNWSLDQYATLVFTSGSSGQPKAALHSLGNHYWSARGALANIALSSDDCWLLTLPLFHVSGLGVVFRCLFAGASMRLAASPELALQNLPFPSHVSLVSTQVLGLLEAKAPLDRLKAVLLGGSAFPESLIREAYQRKWPIFLSYGMTEMASQIATTPPNAPLSCLLKTSGCPLPHREVRLAKDGEIWVRGETRFLGYWQENHLAQPFDEEGWFATGDLGSLDKDGFLSVVGRKDNLFVSGGENIQPEEIENHLRQISGVKEALVVPVPDARYGHRPVAFVRGSVSAQALSLALSAFLPRYKIPDLFLEWPSHENPPDLKPNRPYFQQKALAHLKKTPFE